MSYNALCSLVYDDKDPAKQVAHFPVLVVCAGAKDIIGIFKKIEALETASVPDFTLNQTYFPAFYTRKNGSRSPSPAIVRNVKDAALVFKQVMMSLKSGALLDLPLPSEAGPDVEGM